MSGDAASVDKFRNSIDSAKSYAEVRQAVKDPVEFSLGNRRGRMMLFLDDLPLQLWGILPTWDKQYRL